MNSFPGLDLVDENTPVLDPFIYDMQYKPLSQKVLDIAYANIIQRLEGAGFNTDYDIRLYSSYSLDLFIEGISYYVNNNILRDAVYLLTFSARDRKFIMPPYRENSHVLMTWEEWGTRISQGEKLKILITATWAQAKFINVGIGEGESGGNII